MNRFAGRTVLVSGAARGQGRSHALRFAAQGADLVLFDLCAPMTSVPFPLATSDDLDETVQLAREAGARVVAGIADVRDGTQVRDVVARGTEEFGRLDVAVANAGVVGHPGPVWELDEQTFRDVLDVNVVGVWHVLREAIVAMKAGGHGGSVVVTGSGASVKGLPNLAHYVASKHALVGLVRTAARDAGRDRIRVNLVAPGNVDTPMLRSDAVTALYLPDVAERTEEVFAARAAQGSPLGIPWVDAGDVSDAVLFLASDDARHVTGTVLPVDGGSGMP